MDFFRPSSPPVPVPAMPIHPFYPIGVAIPSYVANEMGTVELLTIFALGCLAILSILWFTLGKLSREIGFWDKMAILWFTLSGTIHLFFEGYFSYNHASMAGQSHLFAQWWKEYALSDSRYLTSDAFTLCMETITAFVWGPMCYVIALFIVQEHPLRHPLQLIVSLGQIYGDLLYYSTAMFDHYFKSVTYCRPESYYFWSYFFFLNFIWIVIPGVLLYQSVARSRDAFAALSKMQKSLQTHGRITRAEGKGDVSESKANGHTKNS